MKLIDIHTHSRRHVADIEVQNIAIQDFPEELSDGLYSVGFHPWDIPRFDERDMINLLHDISDNEQIIAIGECGLDRVVAGDMEVQERVFLKQAGLAEIRRKPLVIHCVRAYNDIIRLHKELRPRQAWILHGYAGNVETTAQLLHYNMYFSFGASLFDEKQKAGSSLKLIPRSRIFFETDEAETDIQKIYFFAADLLKMNVEELAEQVAVNYKTLFPNG